jgi:hypothetical protein
VGLVHAPKVFQGTDKRFLWFTETKSIQSVDIVMVELRHTS